MKPTVGRIVHYVDPESYDHDAAIVTKVNGDGTVNLKVFGPTDTEWRATEIPESNDHIAFTWHWPER